MTAPVVPQKLNWWAVHALSWIHSNLLFNWPKLLQLCVNILICNFVSQCIYYTSHLVQKEHIMFLIIVFTALLAIKTNTFLLVPMKRNMLVSHKPAWYQSYRSAKFVCFIVS